MPLALETTSNANSSNQAANASAQGGQWSGPAGANTNTGFAFRGGRGGRGGGRGGNSSRGRKHLGGGYSGPKTSSVSAGVASTSPSTVNGGVMATTTGQLHHELHQGTAGQASVQVAGQISGSDTGIYGAGKFVVVANTNCQCNCNVTATEVYPCVVAVTDLQ